MQLYHSSQNGNISVFEPRRPTAIDWDGKPLVWAVSTARLYNYLLPRECPRISFFKTDHTTEADFEKYIFNTATKAVVLIEQHWLKTILKTTLYLYEFDATKFYLLDENASYYVSEQTEQPRSVRSIHNIFEALFNEQVEIRLVKRLNDYVEQIANASLGFSMIRMQNAKP